MKKTFKKKLDDLINIHDIQGQKGTWNYDVYNLGLYNGLEMALSIMQERESVFKELSK